MRIKLVTDSSADLLSMEDVAFASAPLKIITAHAEYIDNDQLNVEEMVDDLFSYKGRSSTSCPNPDDWLQAFGDADEVICVTITGTLSGSYNAACSAKAIYEETHPGRRVFVLNSLSTGPEIALILERARTLILDGKCFDEICQDIVSYQQKTGLLFMLESMKNLANNGRVGPLVAKMAGILGIRLVGKASEQGDLEPLSKCRGEKKALETILQHMSALGFAKGKVRICHCFNESAAQELKARIQAQFSRAQVIIDKCCGLCSFYAEKGGMLIGFEKM